MVFARHLFPYTYPLPHVVDSSGVILVHLRKMHSAHSRGVEVDRLDSGTSFVLGHGLLSEKPIDADEPSVAFTTVPNMLCRCRRAGVHVVTTHWAFEFNFSERVFHEIPDRLFLERRPL